MSAAQVLPQTGAVLDWVTRYNGGKPLYIDQFLFTDNTPGFEENPKLDEVQMPGITDPVRPDFKGKDHGIWDMDLSGLWKQYDLQQPVWAGENWLDVFRPDSDSKSGRFQSVGTGRLWTDFPDR